MNSTAIIAQTLPQLVDCQALVRTRLIGASVFGISVIVLEFWLRVPIRPVLDCYLQTVLERASSIAAVVCPIPSL